MNQEIATTILNQLGGRRFVMMTGAKDFIITKNELSFKIGRNCNSINRVLIALDPSDTYTIKFCRDRLSKKTWEFSRKVVNEISDVYCDMLQPVFTQYTGLDTRMPLIRGINC